ncbi:BatA domain-containing protein [Crateriforma conspicua]|uniref:VWFA domain-containing protein n=1 Tax=Crateriforma conspicua TaxID=2527996 RepID=A0A5C6FKL6_9PLAN|nr:BatA domain-containing protein [Crateriforma conspicua]TWU62670.1 hypothetical protein V7x_44060 [Crateriforma conspicua]
MSLLAPLYLIGATAIALPIILHLIRRKPKSQMTFSSLMFLRPSPPKLTKRSRLDDWPLLLIRALALLLIAIAFARPFLRSSQTTGLRDVGRNVVLMIDTSASMRRAGIPDAVRRHAQTLADQLGADDRISIIAFDSQPRTVVDFQQATAIELAARRQLILDAVDQSPPSWRHTDMAAALMDAADLVTVGLGDNDRPDQTQTLDELDDGIAVPTQVVLISDLQAGADLEALQAFAWPDNVRLDVRLVKPSGSTNASPRLLNRTDATSDLVAAADDAWRIRITNSENADHGNFRLAWGDSNAFQRSESELDIQVPPGQTRVVSMTPPKPGDATLILSGDDDDFDNTFYFVTPEVQRLTLLHVGDAQGPPQQRPGFYLSQVPLANADREVDFRDLSAADSAAIREVLRTEASADEVTLPLVVLTAPVQTDVAEDLLSYVENGGHVVAAIGPSDDDARWQQTLESIGDLSGVRISEATVDDYAMWSQIDFRDPLFKPMADPKFNDFSKIRFWAHRELIVDPPADDSMWKVPCRFDDGQIAIARRTLGKGRLTILTSGWDTEDSQLALSTKFIPLVFAWFEASDTVASDQGNARVVGIPDAAGIVWEAPGIQKSDDGDATVAVNLPASESRTEPLDLAALENLGIPLGKVEFATTVAMKDRQLRDVELESEQGLWRMALLVALGLIACETVYSAIRRQVESTEMV